MEIEITPEPTEEERAAVSRALGAGGASGSVSLWWAAGIREAVGSADELEPPPWAPPTG